MPAGGLTGLITERKSSAKLRWMFYDLIDVSYALCCCLILLLGDESLQASSKRITDVRVFKSKLP